MLSELSLLINHYMPRKYTRSAGRRVGGRRFTRSVRRRTGRRFSRGSGDKVVTHVFTIPVSKLLDPAFQGWLGISTRAPVIYVPGKYDK